MMLLSTNTCTRQVLATATSPETFNVVVGTNCSCAVRAMFVRANKQQGTVVVLVLLVLRGESDRPTTAASSSNHSTIINSASSSSE